MDLFAAEHGLPVYVHTQAWSYKAILLYISLGFKIQRTDTFSHYENQYEEAMRVLQGVVTEKQFETMKKASDL